MTGRELIIYIMSNGLENEEIVNEKGEFLCGLTIDDVALKLGTGRETVKALITTGKLEALNINGRFYIAPSSYQRLRLRWRT